MMKKINLALCVLTMMLCMCGCGPESWCVGKWSGSDNKTYKTTYVIQLHSDGTADVHFQGFHVHHFDSSFKANWEPYADGIVKIYDNSGHTVRYSNGKIEQLFHWTMFLQKDGAFSSSPQKLKNSPWMYLEKK